MTARSKICIAAVLVASMLLFVTWRMVGIPVLPLWLIPVSLGGLLVAWMPRPVAPPGSRILDLLMLYAVVVPISLLAIFLAARSRTQAARIVYHGVRLSDARSVAIGANDDSLDVSLQSGARGEPWHVDIVDVAPAATRRTTASWSLVVSHPPEELLVANQAGWLTGKFASRAAIEFWEPLNGQLVKAGEAVKLTVPSNAAYGFPPGEYEISLEAIGDDLVLHLGAFSWYVWQSTDSLNFRNQRLVRQGRYLSQLRPHSVGSAGILADLVRIRELRWNERVNEPATLVAVLGSLLDKMFGNSVTRSRFIVSTAAPLSFDAGQTQSYTPKEAERATELVARDGGDAWRFRWTATNRDVDVEFIRRPRSRSLPLTAVNSCARGAACNVAGLRRLLPPAEQLLFSEGGLDSSRFSLFGRFFAEGGSVWFVSDTGRVSVSWSDEGTWLPAARRPGAPAGASASVNVSAASNSVANPVQVVLIGASLMCLLGAMFYAIRSFVAGGALNVGAIAERPFALALNALLALAVARLILGLRVTVFTPFNQLGVDTAVGLWVSLATAVGILLTWRMWFRRVLDWSMATATTGSVRFSLRAGRRLTTNALRSLEYFLASLRARISTYSHDVRAAVALAVLAFAGLLGTTRGALLYGFGLGATIPAIWAAVAIGLVLASRNSGGVVGNCRVGPWGYLDADLPAPASKAGMALVGRILVWLALPALLAVVVPELFLAMVLILFAVGWVRRQVARPAMNDKSDHTAAMSWSQESRTWALVGAPFFVLALSSTSRSAAALALALFVAMLALRLSASVAQAAEVQAPSQGSDRLAALGLPAVVFVMLLPLVATDVGLFLVVMTPVMLAAIIAVGGGRSGTLRRTTAFAVLVAALGLLGWKLLGQPAERILAGTPEQVDDEVRGMQSWFMLERFEKLRRSLANVGARGLAAKDQAAAERALALAGPSETRDYLAPAIEQSWGTKAYSAAGLFGSGLGEAPIGGRGVATPVAYAEHSFAVFVLAEHGLAGGFAIILCYFLLAAAATGMLTLRSDLLIGSRNLSMRALLFLSVALVILPATYVALSNVGTLPITGQNMPFLGLNARSDVLFTTGVLTFFLVAAIRLHGEAVGKLMARSSNP